MDAYSIEHENIIDFWRDRIREAVHHVTYHNERGLSTISDLRVAKNWPAQGSIRFTRDADGQRFKLYTTKRTFKCVPV